MALLREQPVGQFDAEAVSAIADARQDQSRTVLARNRRGQPGFAVEQFKTDPFRGRRRIPNPAIYRAPVGLDMALQSTPARDPALARSEVAVASRTGAST